jgi:PAT family beta-lactamase induction signal transducer AmpG
MSLIFAVLPVGAMALAYATLTTMQVDYGLAEIQIAEISVYNTIASALGCIIGGALGDRFGLKRMLGTFYLLTALPTLILALQITNVGLESVSLQLFYGIVISYGLFFGMAFGLRPAIFMGMTNPAVAATQFTAFMGLGNLGISITNYWQGIVAQQFDYALVLYLDSLLLIVPLLILPFLKNREESPELARA